MYDRPLSNVRTARAALALGVLALASSMARPSALALPPAFPDNIVVFPERDFVTLEGFQDYVGESATVEVWRGNQIVGSAQGVVEPGDVAFEINHPGGYCWGTGTGLKVTPDIREGDVVALRIGGAVVGDTIVAGAAVDREPELIGTTMKVYGRLRGASPAFLEQRIVNPEFTTTDVGRRDISAVPGPLTRASKGGYSSQLIVEGDVITAIYVFDSLETAELAATGGGERMMSWQEEDVDGNRQGLTIAEFGEFGGPGMGGCPLGPGQQPAPQPGQVAAVRSADRTSMQVNWTAAVPVPGAAAVTGYSVLAISSTQSSNLQLQVGVRTSASTTGTTVSGLSPDLDYTVEVRSLAGSALSAPFTVATPAGGTGTPADATFAAPAATLGLDGVTLARKENTEIYYTLDGTDPRVADVPSSTARLYVGPIEITMDGTFIKWVAFDISGVFSDTGEGTFDVVVPPGPAAPTNVTATAGDTAAIIKWTAPSGNPTPTRYVVTALPSEGPAITQEASGSATSLTLTRLINGTDYFVTVTGYAGTIEGTSSSVVSVRPVASTIDRLTIGSARWKTSDFRVTGTGSIVGATIRVHRANADNTVGAAITGAVTTVTAPVAPATVGDYEVRLRTGIPTNPGRIYVVSDRGGIAGPFTPSN